MLLAGCGQGAAPEPQASATAAPKPVVVAAPAGAERLILAFGDSLYAGYGLERGQSLPDTLQARLRQSGINATFVNAGVSGDTTSAGRRRLAFALDSMKRKPDLVLLGLGGNDVLRQISPAETRANLTAMMAELKKRGVPVLLTGMRAPPNLGPDFQRAFDPIWTDLAQANQAALDPFILDGVIGNRALMQDDYVHPNAKGIAVIADRLAPLTAATLAKMESAD